MTVPAAANPKSRPQLELLAPVDVAPIRPARLSTVQPTKPVPRAPATARKLWLCLRFEQLPLEVCTAYDPEEPLAVTEIDGQRVRISAVSPAAASLHIRPGMTRSEAQALCPELRLEPCDPIAETHQLKKRAAWAGQFTSWVSLAPPDQLLLEVAGSEQLFGGMDPLITAIRDGLRMRRCEAQVAVAPSARAAQWLACWQPSSVITQQAQLRAALSGLPTEALGLPVKKQARLARTGLHRIADLARLPRDGLARRYGPSVLKQLDEALCLTPETLPAFQTPQRFSAEAELPLPSAQTPRLLAAAERLIAQLVDHLRAHDSAVDRFGLRLFHEQHPATVITVGLAVATRDGARLLRLLGEHLERTTLPADACSARIEAANLMPYSSGTIDALDDTGDDDWLATLERWQARLSNQQVHGLSALADYRPEYAWARHRPGQDRPCQSQVSAPRPSWLLPEPVPLITRDDQPIYNGSLTVETGPERIEQGWWDHRTDAHNQSGDVSRDYYVMRDRFGARLWVFQDRRKLGWWLHGHFV